MENIGIFWSLYFFSQIVVCLILVKLRIPFKTHTHLVEWQMNKRKKTGKQTDRQENAISYTFIINRPKRRKREHKTENIKISFLIGSGTHLRKKIQFIIEDRADVDQKRKDSMKVTNAI